MPEVTIDLVHLKPAQVDWDALYLDPNNPRLAGMSESVVVPDEAITDARIQADLASNLREVGISDITDKIKSLGFLQIDRIVVRPIVGQDGAYVVLEGNRRVAALRSIRGNAA